jgi:diguanylate cyclase (GGDEF)-like protein
MGLFGLHAAVYLLRIPLTAAMTFPPGATILQSKWLAYGILEALAHAFVTSFILVAMVKERLESRHKRAAVIDALTDVPNRRGFLELAERMVDACRAQRPVTLLLFDLDHFKTVNDTFGHQAGDTVLTAFCRAAQSRLGPDDLFGRLGGEEFACLTPVPLHGALGLAERIRADFDASIWAVDQEHVHATVSIGVATSADVGHDLKRLLAASDKALYRAKAKGRNRVECPRPELTLLPAAAAG